MTYYFSEKRAFTSQNYLFIIVRFNCLYLLIEVNLMEKKPDSLTLQHKLRFWYQHFVKGEDTFQDSLKPVADIETVQDFWAYYQHFNRPTDLPIGSVKPVWQDEHNKNGGAFVLRFEKIKSNRLWEDVLLGYISANAEIQSNLNGIRIKIKKDYAEIDFWVAKITDEKNVENYRKWIVDVTTLENDTPLEVIHFQAEQ